METSSSSITTVDESPVLETSLIFVSCIQGLESYLVNEIKALGIPSVKIARAGALIPGACLEDGLRICYGSRLALRVLWQMHNFRTWKPQNLYQQLVKQPWQKWLGDPKHPKMLRSFRLNVSGQNRHFPNTHFAVQRAKDAICDHLRETTGGRPNIEKDDPDVRLQLHLEEDAISLYFDLSGAPLNQRGYRAASVEAPLNELVAASLLALAGYDGFRPFADPCCGSGTLVIEAGMIRTKTAPGFLRKKWGFQNHPLFDSTAWQTLRDSFDSQREELPSGWLLGIDKDVTSINLAKASAAKLGFKTAEWIVGKFQDQNLESQRFVLTNPPFGRRLQDPQLQALYRDLGTFFKAYASRAFAFCSEEELLQNIGLPALQSFPIDFSGTRCLLQRFKVMREVKKDQ